MGDRFHAPVPLRAVQLNHPAAVDEATGVPGKWSSKVAAVAKGHISGKCVWPELVRLRYD
jgi:hypothetical protein